MSSRVKVPILMYHSVSDAADYRGLPPSCRPIGYRITPGDFQEHLDCLRAGGWTTVGIADLLAAGEGRGELPTRPVILTFDDGYADNFDLALPRLRAGGFRAAFFLSVAHLGRPGMLTGEQARLLREAGMEVGSHGMNHSLLAGRTESELRWELEESRCRLGEELGVGVEYFSLPRGYLPPVLPTLAREAGYRALCTSRPGYNTLGNDPFALRRFPIRSGFSPSGLAALLAGRGWGYAGIYLSERARDLLRIRHRRSGGVAG